MWCVMDFKTGGQEVIKRLLEVYGFSSRQALAAHLGVSSGTMGTRWMRDFFPADWVIQCTIETGASVEWLSFGKGEMFHKHNEDIQIEKSVAANEHIMSDIVTIPRKKIIEGKIFDSNFNVFDKTIIPTDIKDPNIIWDDDIVYLIDKAIKDVTNGKWLVCIEGKYNIRNITRIPVGMVIVRDKDLNFQCRIEDIKFLGKVALTINIEK